MTALVSDSHGKPTSEGPSRYDLRRLERDARLWSGLILMAFVTSHFLNHALGIFGLEVMSAAQEWRILIWRSPLGGVALGGAALVHAGLALKRAVSRRTWRMPKLEALQIVLGLLIPFMLLSHVASTRAIGVFAGYDDSYVHVLRNIWQGFAYSQSLALLIVWTHGVIGIHSAFHMRRWFKSFRIPLGLLAALVPALALAGFVAAGREAIISAVPPEPITAEQFNLFTATMSYGRAVLWGGLGVLAGYVVFRSVRARIAQGTSIRYFGQGEVPGLPGQTLLEISRSNGIPHPSACGDAPVAAFWCRTAATICPSRPVLNSGCWNVCVRR
jgi:adenylate cyclase